MDNFHFDLVSPERLVFSGEVEHVVVPGSEGEFGVLAHHAPLLAMLRPGILTILGPGQPQRIVVGGGFAEVAPDGLTVHAALAVAAAVRAWQPRGVDSGPPPRRPWGRHPPPPGRA